MNLWKNRVIHVVVLSSLAVVLSVLPVCAEQLIVRFGEGGVSTFLNRTEAKWKVASFSFRVRALISASGVSALKTEPLPYLGMAIITLGGDVDNAINSLDSSDWIENVTRSNPVYAYGEVLKKALPNDPFYPRQWFHNSEKGIDSEGAWEVTSGDASLVVAVIDTGVDYNHPDITNRMWSDPETGDHGYNAADGNNNPMDSNGHGTHVAGLIAAEANNELGVVGVAPDVKIMAIKVLGEDGTGTEADVVRGINYILSKKAEGVDVRLVNMSLGGEAGDIAGDSTPYQSLSDAGILSFIAAGNAYNDNDVLAVYPANYEVANKIVVGATWTDGRSMATPNEWGYSTEGKPNGSNYGQNTVDIFAPGSMILSTLLNDSYGGDNSDVGGTVSQDWSGTSMATPIVAGVGALIWSYWPDWSAQDVRSLLLQSGVAVSGLSTRCLFGKVVNASKALNSYKEVTGNLYRLTGTVYASGAPSAAVAVSVNVVTPSSLSVAAKEALPSATYTDSVGQYSFRLPNGVYTVGFRKSGSTFEEGKVKISIEGSTPLPVDAYSVDNGGGTGCSTGFFSVASLLLALPLLCFVKR